METSPWGSISHKSNSRDVISIVDSDCSEDDVSQYQQICTSASQSPSSKSLDDMIDSSDDELAKLSMSERRQIAREKWNECKEINGMYPKNDKKVYDAITAISCCSPAVPKEQLRRKQRYVEGNHKIDTMRNRKDPLDYTEGFSSEQPISIQNSQRSTDKLKSPTDQLGGNSESNFDTESIFDTVSKRSEGMPTLGVHCLPGSYNRHECSDLSVLQSPLQKLKDRTCTHPLRIKAQMQQQVKQRKDINEKSLVRLKNATTTCRSPEVHPRVVSDGDIQERKRNTSSVQHINGTHTMNHKSGTIKNYYNQQYTFSSKSKPDSSVVKSQKEKLTAAPRNGKIAQCLLSKRPDKSKSCIGRTTSQQIEDQKSECIPHLYKFMEGISRNERTNDLTVENELLETGGNLSDSTVLPVSQSNCSIQQSNNTSPSCEMSVGSQCKRSISPRQCTHPSPTVYKTEGTATTSHSHEEPTFIECDAPVDTISDDSRNNSSAARNLSSDIDLEKDNEANLHHRSRDNHVIKCRSMRVRTNINYKEHEDLPLTAASYIYYTPRSNSRLIPKRQVRNVPKEMKQDLISKPRGRPRKKKPTESSNLDSIPDQADKSCCGNDRDLMASITHLSQKSFDHETHFPRQKISVLNCIDGMYGVSVISGFQYSKLTKFCSKKQFTTSKFLLKNLAFPTQDMEHS